VPSGHAMGKDYVAGGLALWWLYSFKPAKVIITAPTERQVKEVMWHEITSKYHASKTHLPGDLKTLRLKISDDRFILGFTTKDSNATGKAQGLHSPNLLVIVSEAQAVEDSIYEQFEGIMTSDNCRMLLLFNPLRSTGKAARSVTDDTYKTIHLSCLDSPNYIEKKEVIPGVASYDWVESRRKEWGEDDPRWYARILGQIPPMGVDNVISMDLITRNLERTLIVNTETSITAVDIAGSGIDETVIYNFKNGRVVDLQTLGQATGPQNAMAVQLAAQKNNSTVIIGDADGLGAQTMDFIRQAVSAQDIKVISMHGSGSPTDESFQNTRAEMYWNVRTMLETGQCSVPKDDRLIEELVEPTYFANTRGKIQLEKKDDIKERLGRSPDRGDAYVMGVWAQRFIKIIPISDYRDKMRMTARDQRRQLAKVLAS